MPRPVKFTMVVDRRKEAAGAMSPPSYRLHLPRPMMVGATLLFWAALVIGLKLLAS